MTNPDDPAFLTIEHYPSGSKTISSGLTKREWFAGIAMQGFLAGIHAFPDAKILLNWHPNGMAIYCLKIADALIADLSKESK